MRGVLTAEAALEIAGNTSAPSAPLWLLKFEGNVCQACLQEETQDLVSMCVLILAMLPFLLNVFVC